LRSLNHAKCLKSMGLEPSYQPQRLCRNEKDPRNLAATGASCFLLALRKIRKLRRGCPQGARRGDTRSCAGLAHGGPCGEPQHGNSGEIGVLPLPAKRRAAPCRQAVPAPLARPMWAHARRKGEQGQTARRRFRRHVVKPDRCQFPERANGDAVTLRRRAILGTGGKPSGDFGGGGHSASPVASGASTSTRDAMPASTPGL